MFDTSLKGLLYFSKSLTCHMKAKDTAHFVNLDRLPAKQLIGAAISIALTSS